MRRTLPAVSAVISGLAGALFATTIGAQPTTKSIKTQLGDTVVETTSADDPITARMDSNMEVKLAGPIGIKIPARDLPIVGSKIVDNQKLWVVQFGAKNSYAVLVDGDGRIFSLAQENGKLQVDRKLKPTDALITPLPR